MKIEIVNNPTKGKSKEFEAAEELKKMLVASTKDTLSGKIYIASNLTLCGQEVRDIDIAVWGSFSNYKLPNFYTNDKRYPKKDLEVISFIMTLELKRLPIDLMFFKDTHIWGVYPDKNKDITDQSEKERYSLRRYLKSYCDVEAFVTNALWLYLVSKEELHDLTNGLPVGALPNYFTLKNLIEVAILQNQKPWYDQDKKCYVLSAFDDENSLNTFKNKLFFERRVSSKLTRKRLELLTQKNTENIIVNKVLGNELTTLCGKAGTGKTFILLQAAYQLATQSAETSCVLLTYNLALVSDIRRLVHYLFPDNIEEDKIQITTLHKFFMRIMDVYGISTRSINGSSFNREYQKKLKELFDYVKEMDKDDVLDLKKRMGRDYVLIDEAQDWDPLERDILLKVYGAEKLIAADGGPQLVRSNRHLDWGGRDIPLEVGRRQKALLVHFVNALAQEMGISWEQKSDRNLSGGKVRILRNYDDVLHSQLTAYCKEQQCENYDMLFLAPPKMIEHENDHSYFRNLQKWKELGIAVFDGTDERKRDEYPSRAEECRLFQYESCRGLEGWVVVCLQFDTFINEKKDKFDVKKHAEESVALESYDEKLNRYLWMWSMLPFTRAIDTLIITLKDPKSETGRLLKRLSDNNPDIVTWEI